MKRKPLGEYEKEALDALFKDAQFIPQDVREFIYHIDEWLDYFLLSGATISKSFIINKVNKDFVNDVEFMYGRRKYNIADTPPGVEIVTSTHAGHKINIFDIDKFLELDHYRKAANQELLRYFEEAKDVIQSEDKEETAPKLKMYWSYSEKKPDGSFFHVL